MYSLTREERTWAMLSHLLALVGYFVIPFGNIVAPLIIYAVKKDESPFVADQARESLNLQISRWIYGLIIGFLALTLSMILVGFWLRQSASQVTQNPAGFLGSYLGSFFLKYLIGILLLAANWGLGAVLTLIAAIKASDGKSYRYPLTIRLIR